VCIEESVKYTYTDDEDEARIDEGIYALTKEGDEWKARCTATVYVQPKIPEDNYNEWENLLRSFLKERGIFDLKTYMPVWVYVRSHC
jgi:hypothetical protein